MQYNLAPSLGEGEGGVAIEMGGLPLIGCADLPRRGCGQRSTSAPTSYVLPSPYPHPGQMPTKNLFKKCSTGPRSQAICNSSADALSHQWN